ncbi:male sterility protein-domain-containing protein [Aspergillus pseudotamarii]|uniref:Fatty acyl-CoA reductase n=1 Tax=Aspergillus pseudotamarii TaxID=132259 RepID=A0A5N6T5V9_ASPPS|nr:male sterility protein-domain-containing protein [Aspergillus pseudotamarii]KAE8141703.1 male sterility protein-domain-containing protein [Aspergillus pseudotamarii]
MLEYYKNKSIFVTGAPGFLGTVIIYRLISLCEVQHVYVLCRGGIQRLRSNWSQVLPEEIMNTLCDPSRITVFDGDVRLPDMGISKNKLDMVRTQVDVIIHAASSINLGTPLAGLFDVIIRSSDMIGGFALSCSKLRRFVYISTAYANGHLSPSSHTCDIEVDERVYDLGSSATVIEELAEVERYGTSKAYQAHEFPWPYAYAKNLTERLLVRRFQDNRAMNKLLIVRPSIVGPSQSVPYPGFCLPLSAPMLMLAAGMTLTTSQYMRIGTNLTDPDSEATLDGVPVDVVADRIITHVAAGTAVCIHAVSGERGRYKTRDVWQQAMQFRPIPWGLKLHFLCRRYNLLGVSYTFLEKRTVELSNTLSPEEHKELQLFTQVLHFRYIFDRMAPKDEISWLAAKASGYMFGDQQRVSKL